MVKNYKSHCTPHIRGIYCPIIRAQGGGGKKPVPLEYFGEENLYLMDFSYFTHENLVFETFLEKF